MCSFSDDPNANNLPDIYLGTSEQTTQDIKPSKHDFSDPLAYEKAKEDYKQKKDSLIKDKGYIQAQTYKKKETGLSENQVGYCYTPEEAERMVKMFNNSITWEWVDQVWKMTENTSFIKEGVRVEAFDNNGDEVEVFVEINGTNKFFGLINESNLPLSKFTYRIYNDYNFSFEDGVLIEYHEPIKTLLVRLQQLRKYLQHITPQKIFL